MPRIDTVTMPPVVHSRRFRGLSRLAVIAAAIAAALASAGASSAVLEPLHAVLDNGVCGTNLQIGSNPSASSSATPSFLLYGNGGLSSYRIFIDGVSIGTFDSDGWANVCIHATSPLAEGPHRLTGNELRPNTANTVFPFDFTVDTIPPATPSKPALHVATDSGIVGDGITSFKSLKLIGTAQPGISVQVYRGVVMAAGASTDAAGNWLATTTTLSAGTYQFEALAVDSAGNKSARSDALPVTVDTTLPTAALTSPTAGSTVSGTVTISSSASDAVGLWKLDLKVDGILKKNFTGTPLVGSPFTHAWDSTGVTNGSHTFSAVATDLAGNVTTATSSVVVSNGTGATVPGAPTLTSALAGNGLVTLAWSPPASDGGFPITIYTATASPGGATCASITLGCTIGGLSNGTSYSFTVTASNAIGSGPASNALSATPSAPASVPSAPTLTSASAGNGSVTLGWTAPASTGGSPISGYTATASPGGNSCTTTALGCTIGGLSNGTSYSFTVTASNAIGSGPASNALSATPMTVPGAPTLISAVPGNSVTLAWGAPSSTGGLPITGYRIYRGTISGFTTFLASVGPVTTYRDDTTLYGTTYYFQVSALSAAGEGPKSNQLSATPQSPSDTTPPSTPGSLKALVIGTAQVALDWLDSNDNTGVAGYEVFRNGALVGTSAKAHFLDSGLTAGVTYTYSVRAFDAAGNRSSPTGGMATKTLALAKGGSGILAGAVLSAASTPLANASVSLTLGNGSVKTATTSASGVWKVQKLSPGTVTVRITLAGYTSQTFTMAVAQGRTVVALTELSP